MKKNTNRLLFCLLLGWIFPGNAWSRYSPEIFYQKAESLIYINPGQAAYYCQQGIANIENTNDSVFKTRLHILYGYAAILQGDFDLGLSIYYDALDFCPPYALSLRAQIDMRMSSLYCTLKDYNKALELIERASSRFKSIGDSLGLANCYNTRGIIHVNLNENDMAEYFFKNALAINRKFGDRKAVAANINNLCLYEGNNEEKIALLKEALQINRSLNAMWAVGENYNNLGVQYFYAGRYDEAIAALARAKEIADDLHAKELICDNYLYRSWIYESRKMYENAYKTLLIHYRIVNELQSEKKLRQIEREILDKRYIMQQNEALLKEQSHHISMLKKNIAILVIVLAALMLIGLFFCKWYKKRKKLQLAETRYKLELSERELVELKVKQQGQELYTMQQQLQLTKHELTDFAVLIKSHNDLLEKIRDMIRESYKLDPANLLTHNKKINAFITQYKNTNIGARGITEKVESQNREFIRRLTEKYPDMTASEKHLATLLRINISTKEISILTGALPKTINMSRYRLRKRLNLKPDEDLSLYLQNI